MRETRWLRPRSAGSPEASFSARSCSRLPQASASVGQSASWAALAGQTGLVFDLGACCARARSKRRAAATARAGAGAPGQGSRLRIRVRVRFRVRIRIRIRVRVGSGLTRQKSGAVRAGAGAGAHPWRVPWPGHRTRRPPRTPRRQCLASAWPPAWGQGQG
eukprot:scaffold22994_cov63-Phaeocystis_antarctica.AAC.5